MIPTIVKFTYNTVYLGERCYICDLPGDQSGEYVPLAEYRDEVTDLMYSLGEGAEIISGQASQIKDLRRLVERVAELESILSDSPDIKKYGPQSDNLKQLLADCRKALEGGE